MVTATEELKYLRLVKVYVKHKITPTNSTTNQIF